MASPITKVNYWTEDGSEYYSAWCGDSHDHSGDVPAGVDPRGWLAEQFPGAAIAEVDRTY